MKNELKQLKNYRNDLNDQLLQKTKNVEFELNNCSIETNFVVEKTQLEMSEQSNIVLLRRIAEISSAVEECSKSLTEIAHHSFEKQKLYI